MQKIIFGADSLAESDSTMEEDSIKVLKTFNLIKQIIWNCVVGQENIDRRLREVQLDRLIGLLAQIETYLEVETS